MSTQKVKPMFQLMQSTENPFSKDGGILKQKLQTVRFTLAKRSFESQLKAILRAVAGHGSNSLAVGASEYRVLADDAHSLCSQVAHQ